MCGPVLSVKESGWGLAVGGWKKGEARARACCWAKTSWAGGAGLRLVFQGGFLLFFFILFCFLFSMPFSKEVLKQNNQNKNRTYDTK